MVDVNDKDELMAWLETLPPKARTSFAARAALRSLPVVFSELGRYVQTLAPEAFVLASFRNALISAVAGTYPAQETSYRIHSAAKSAAESTADELHSASQPTSSSHASAKWAARSVDNNALSFIELAVGLSESAIATSDLVDYRVRFAANSSTRSAHSSDHKALSEAPDETVGLFGSPLWTDGVPEIFLALLQSFETTVPGTQWAFWAEWYRGMLDGQPMDWELQRRVALIPHEDWDKGAAQIADVIAGVRARYDVETALADVKGGIPTTAHNRQGIGGNFPPDVISDPNPAQAVTIIWAAVDDLSDALKEGDDPSRERVAAILVNLKAGLTAILKWGGRKIDLAIDTVIVAGVTSIVAGTGYLAANPDKLKRLIDAMEAYVPFLS